MPWNQDSARLCAEFNTGVIVKSNKQRLADLYGEMEMEERKGLEKDEPNVGANSYPCAARDSSAATSSKWSHHSQGSVA